MVGSVSSRGTCRRRRRADGLRAARAAGRCQGGELEMVGKEKKRPKREKGFEGLKGCSRKVGSEEEGGGHLGDGASGRRVTG